jgi:hypothetical protein
MIEATIVDVLEQDDHWLRGDGSLVPLSDLDSSEAASVLTTLLQRASLLWFAAMWRADRRYVQSEVPAANIVSPVDWLEDRPLVRSLRQLVYLGNSRSVGLAPAPPASLDGLATTA